jgi:hypothetical protein
MFVVDAPLALSRPSATLSRKRARGKDSLAPRSITPQRHPRLSCMMARANFSNPSINQGDKHELEFEWL